MKSVLHINDLNKHYTVKSNFFQTGTSEENTVKAVNGINLALLVRLSQSPYSVLILKKVSPNYAAFSTETAT